MLGLALAAFTVSAAGEKGAKDAKKDAAKDGKDKGVTGLLTKVDAEKGTFTISPEKGKDRTFMVNESTKFIGPKGGSRGMGKAGLKDDTMVKGNEVTVVPAADGKAAAEVHLPTRKSEPKSADKKDKK